MSSIDGHREAFVIRSSRLQCIARLTFSRPAPFYCEHQLNHELDRKVTSSSNNRDQHLPGHPRISLSDIPRLTSFLEAEFHSEDLEKMAPHLWVMSLHSNANISPLHRQIVKGREITITEDPNLHLVWLPNRIHIKPLPAYLLSFNFWDHYLLRHTSPLPSVSRHRILESALGYLRTYFYLIRYESDFVIAQKNHLLPGSISWIQFCAFTSRFDTISDAEVSKRYTFGELRLTRLNLYCKLILGKERLYRVPTTTYGSYFSRFYPPFLFIFAVLSVVLSAMQVALAVESLAPNKWPRLWAAGRVVAVSTLVFSLVLAVLLSVLLMFRFVSEWRHAIFDEMGRRRMEKGQEKPARTSGAV